MSFGRWCSFSKGWFLAFSHYFSEESTLLRFEEMVWPFDFKWANIFFWWALLSQAITSLHLYQIPQLKDTWGNSILKHSRYMAYFIFLHWHGGSLGDKCLWDIESKLQQNSGCWHLPTSSYLAVVVHISQNKFLYISWVVTPTCNPKSQIFRDLKT